MAVAAARQPVSPVPKTGRLVSLDAFRGATIAAMILVNNAGSWKYVYPPLEHSAWNGWTFTDLIFPFFLWIVGLSMTISFARRKEIGADRRKLFLHAVRRGAIIFALGLFIYGFPYFDLSTLRIMGVLQRIGICYVIASAIFLTTGVRGQILWILSLLTAYWLIMMLAPVPGVGSGYLDVDRNFAHYVDSIVLGRHNYASTGTWDPEGIVSTLPAIATTLFGILAGHLLRLPRSVAEKTAWLLAIGNALIAAGLVMNTWMPINKKLWTSSFSVFMAGMATVAFGICYWLADGNGWKRWTRPFLIFGMNAIMVYVFSEIFAVTLSLIHPAPRVDLQAWIFDHLFLPLASPVNASLLYAVAYVGVCYAVAWIMYRRNWFVKI